MIVTCPRCQTRFRLDEGRLARGRPLLRCSRCRHTFPPPASRPRRQSSSPDGESLTFAFDEEEDWSAEPAGETELEEEEFLLREPSARPRERLPSTRVPSEPVPILGADPEEEEDEFEADEEEDMDGSEATRVSLKPVLVFLFLVVAAYAIFARALYADPRWADDLLGDLPMLGGDLGERALDRQVALIELEGHHERTKDGDVVFVITGKAVNRSGGRLKNVQIASTLFDAEGKPIDRQLSFCGNTVRIDLIRNLNRSQVAILAGLKPPHYFSVQPAATCPFVSIFTDAPAALASFAAEVATVQRYG